jgi:hypothetical protein
MTNPLSRSLEIKHDRIDLPAAWKESAPIAEPALPDPY